MSIHAPVEYIDIERALLLETHRGRSMPRFTPVNWWECDVCHVTESGYFREFEIKMTRADFRIDADKQREIFPRPYGEPAKFENKHALLAAGDPRGPSAFYFCTPRGLLTEIDIPLWAGWIEVSRTFGGNPYVRTLKKAPRLHRQKAAPSIVSAMLSSSHGRLHGVWVDEYHMATASRNWHESREKRWRDGE
jgi:hypothetical protein